MYVCYRFNVVKQFLKFNSKLITAFNLYTLCACKIREDF